MNFKKIVLSILALVAISLSLHAQGTPSYFCSTWSGSGASGSITYDTKYFKYQTIYLPSDFPSMPSGAVKNIYFRLVPIRTSDSTSVQELSIKLGTTDRSAFKSIGFDTFVTNMHQVYFAAKQTFSGIGTTKKMGYWFKFPTSDFIYEHSKNLVVEISRGDVPYADTTQFRLMASKRNIGIYRTMLGHRDSTRWMNPGRENQMDVGFDINPTAVSGLRNIQASGLFPNPSTDGYFMLSLETKQAIKSLNLVLSDVTGRTVLSKQYASVGTEFAEEIDARQLSKGMYLLRITADGETMTKKLILQ